MRGCARWWHSRPPLRPPPPPPPIGERAQMQTRSQQPLVGLLTQETTAAAPCGILFVFFCFSPSPSAHFLAGGLHYPTSTPQRYLKQATLPSVAGLPCLLRAFNTAVLFLSNPKDKHDKTQSKSCWDETGCRLCWRDCFILNMEVLHSKVSHMRDFWM